MEHINYILIFVCGVLFEMLNYANDHKSRASRAGPRRDARAFDRYK